MNPLADPELWMWYEAYTEDRMRDALGNRLYDWLDRLAREKGIEEEENEQSLPVRISEGTGSV